MTLSSGLKQPLPDQMFLHESPNGSSTDLAELGLPQPAFRRRSNASSGLSSNRSSMHSLNGLTSEELWKMDQEANQPDLSNPNRQARERPLDTIRRMSRTYDQPASPAQFGLPGEVIWPSAMPEDMNPPVSAALRSKSTTSIANIGTKSKRLTIRKKGSRNQSFDTPPNEGVYLHSQSPGSLSRPESMIITSSAHSSTTSLNSQGFSPLKLNGNRPPSAYYSRDFLSSLAPREGGYAIAATMGNGLGAHGAMSVDERRRSQVPEMGKRAPMAKSAGMGRWSLDGGEHYARPYGTPSAATTASNLSGPPITSPDVSPPTPEAQLPEGALSPTAPGTSTSMTPSSSVGGIDASPPVVSMPTNPSPLSQQTHAQDMTPPATERSAVPIATAAAGTSSPALASKMSKKDLAKEAKAQATRQKIEEHKRKAEEKAAAVKAKADRKQAEAKAKDEAKRKEKEEKERRKAEKKGKKIATSAAGRTPGSTMATAPPATALPIPAPVSPQREAQSTPINAVTPAPPQSLSQQGGVKPKASESTIKTQQSGSGSKSKLGFLGTLKKRFSSSEKSSASPDMRAKARQEEHAANLASMPRPPAASMPKREPEVRSSSMAAGTFMASPPSESFATPSTAQPQVPDDFPPQPPVQAESTVPVPEVVAPVAAEEQPPTDGPAPVGSPSSRSLARMTSRDQASPRSRSASLRGPRPMPSAQARTSPRPESITTTETTLPPPVFAPTSAPAPAPAHGFPFLSGNEAATPTTSAESSEFSMSNSGHASSPFTSINSQGDEVENQSRSRKNSLDMGAGAEELERQDSTTPKASDETVQHQPIAV